MDKLYKYINDALHRLLLLSRITTFDYSKTSHPHLSTLVNEFVTVFLVKSGGVVAQVKQYNLEFGKANNVNRLLFR